MAPKTARFWYLWLDVVAIAAWGILFLKYWFTDKLYVLIHPNYMGLTIGAAIGLLLVAFWRSVGLLQQMRQSRAVPPGQHLSLFPRNVSRVLLIGVAIAGMLIPPQPFTSQTAFDRGITDTLNLTRVRPQAFTGSSNTEDKSIIDWIRTLTVYPEPDAYQGQKARVDGFVVHMPNLPANYLMISRFIITCCAADAYPVGLPVQLPEGQTREAYPPDSWQRVEGAMITETLDGKRQLVIQARSLTAIDEPKNPYDY